MIYTTKELKSTSRRICNVEAEPGSLHNPRHEQPKRRSVTCVQEIETKRFTLQVLQWSLQGPLQARRPLRKLPSHKKVTENIFKKREKLEKIINQHSTHEFQQIWSEKSSFLFSDAIPMLSKVGKLENNTILI